MSQLKDDLTKLEEMLATPELWTQGNFSKLENGKWRYCLIGAAAVIADPADEFTRFTVLRDTLQRAIHDLFRPDWPPAPITVAGFNDATGRKHDDILSVIRAAKEIYA